VTTGTFDAAAAKALGERGGDPDWLIERRLESLARFDALPWPDQSMEAWKYTDIRGLDLGVFDPLPVAQPEAKTLDDIPDEVQAAIGEVGERSGFAVQIDADLVHSTLDPELAAKGVIFGSVGSIAAGYPDPVRDALGHAGVSVSEEKVATLAAAFASGGAYLYVPRGVQIPLPLQSFRWLSKSGLAVFPRTVVAVEEGASVTYIDHYKSGPLDGPALAAANVEIYAHPASNVSYLGVQDWAPTVWHFNIQRAVVQRDATLRSLAATLGGKLSRSVVESILDGPGSHSEMLGVYFADGDQRFDHRSLQEHRAPNSSSDLYYKGALKGHSSAVYSGLIHIAKEAQKTDSQQANRNLILSEHAKADSIPLLEIEANDVRCSHGVSVGPPDEDQRFYLESRGLDHDEAEQLIVKGFFQEVLDRVRVPEIRDALGRAVEEELALEERRP
jgi:Fe-S cluster assembly protein SufD